MDLGCGGETAPASTTVVRAFPNSPRIRRTAILVLGVGRSGTSLLAHLLNLLGAALPDQLLGAAHGNPLGHWEPAGLLRLNEEVFGALGRSWHDPRPISASWFRSRTAYVFQERIAAEIASGYGNAPLIVIKEPRICRLAPLYLDALDVLDIDPLVVLPVRHPAEVIQSIRERDGSDECAAELIWLRHLLEAEQASRTTRRVWTSFERLLEDWEETARCISRKLGIAWPNRPEKVAGEAVTIVKPRHRHYHAVNSSNFPALGNWTLEAWNAAQHALVGDERHAQDLFDSIGKALGECDRLSAPRQEWMEQRLAEMTLTIASLNEEIVARNQTISAVHQEIDAIHASRSWRLTAPLRAARTLFGKSQPLASEGRTEKDQLSPSR